MRKMIVIVNVVLAAALLGGCAGNGLGGGSPLPSAPQSVQHHATVVGGGPTPASQVGGGPTPASQVGGGPTPAQQVGGGPTPAQQVGGGPTPAKKKAHRLDLVGGGPTPGHGH